jgi:hypothetical protein
MLQLEVLIGELHPIYALASSAIELSEVPSLHHKPFDDSVKHTVLERKHLSGRLTPPLLPSAQLSKVFSSARCRVLEKLHDHSAGWLAVYLDVKEDSRVRRRRGLLDHHI